MTSLPAKRMNIDRRGQIKEGYFADINIFAPEKVSDHATFEKPMQLAGGIWKCFVNGELVWEDGKMVCDSCGRMLRRREK